MKEIEQFLRARPLVYVAGNSRHHRVRHFTDQCFGRFRDLVLTHHCAPEIGHPHPDQAAAHLGIQLVAAPCEKAVLDFLPHRLGIDQQAIHIEDHSLRAESGHVDSR